MGTLFASWKTSVLGIFVGILVIATGAYAPGQTWKQWALGVGVALWGIVSKDFNATGGTVPATTEAKVRVEK